MSTRKNIKANKNFTSKKQLKARRKLNFFKMNLRINKDTIKSNWMKLFKRNKDF